MIATAQIVDNIKTDDGSGDMWGHVHFTRQPGEMETSGGKQFDNPQTILIQVIQFQTSSSGLHKFSLDLM